MTDRVRISALRKTGDHQARIAILSGFGGVDVYDIWLERPVPDKPDIRTLIHLIEQDVDGLPDDIIDWLVEDGLPSADLWESLRSDRAGNPLKRIARSLSVAELKRLIRLSVGEIGSHQWHDGYRTRGMGGAALSGFRKGLLIFVSALPALMLLSVLTGGWL